MSSLSVKELSGEKLSGSFASYACEKIRCLSFVVAAR
jgi:hypothetical protein